MEKQIELIPFLEGVLNSTTEHYKEDFEYDIIRLQDAVSEPLAEFRTFYWMARPCGTWTVTERNVFMRDSEDFKIWTQYADAPDGIQAYRVVVTGGTSDKPLGTVRKLNYPEQVKRVEKNALPAVRMEVIFMSGEIREVALDKYMQEREWLFNEYGVTKHIRYCPEDKYKLDLVMKEEHRLQQKRPAKAAAKKPPRREER